MGREATCASAIPPKFRAAELLARRSDAVTGVPGLPYLDLAALFGRAAPGRPSADPRAGTLTFSPALCTAALTAYSSPSSPLLRLA
jgi:hypothetical protein